MARLVLDQSERIGVNATDNGPTRLIFNVDGADCATVQVTPGYSSAGAWVLTVERSNDGTNFYGLSSATTISASGGITDELDVSGFGWLSVRRSTDGSGGDALVRVVAKSTS